jgi:glycosyltransferase involved in cell wall biosynthesis
VADVDRRAHDGGQRGAIGEADRRAPRARGAADDRVERTGGARSYAARGPGYASGVSDARDGRVVVVTTGGIGSMDECGTRLAAELRLPTLHAPEGTLHAELFGVPAASRPAARALAADIAFVRRLRRARPALWHFTNHHTVRYALATGAPFVASVYDAIRQLDARGATRFISRPNRRDRALLRLDAAGARRALAICAPSRATKRDLVAHLGVPAERIAVVPLGIDHGRFRPGGERPLAAPYVLFVGSEHPRKDLPTLLRAFAALRRRRRFRGLRLAKVGDPGTSEARFHATTRTAVAELGLDGAVLFAGRVTDAALPAWYANAECLVLPSLAEGFGLPAAEAMACGCPVVVSDAGALPEVVGDAGVVFPVGDAAALATALAELLSDPGAGAERAARGRQRARAFTWGRAAEETRRVHAAALGAPWRPGDVEPASALQAA